MPESPLLAHLAPAATVTLALWRVAEHFGDIEAEVGAVHDHAGVMERSERGRLEVRGADRVTWLNRIVSNDVTALAEDQAQRAFLLTVKGHLACDLRIVRLSDRLLLETAFDSADGLLAALRRYVVYGDRVTLADVRSDTCQIAVHGPAAADIAGRVTGLDVASLPRLGAVEGDGGLVVVRGDELGEPGFDVIADAGRGLELWTALAAQARPFGWRASEILRLEAGAPRWGAELTPDVMPLETGLEDALSHTKGCYPGQEYVARMRDRGHANRHLRALSIAGDEVPARGTELSVQDKSAGTITSAARSPRLGVRAMGYVRTAYAGPGTVLRAGSVEATVL
jgi:folate-binding protein YgfZ